MSLTGIVNAADFRESVLDQRDLLAEKSDRQVTETGPSASSAPDVGIQELRDAVLRIEALLTRIADRSGTPGG
mgnify:CR=1 FL=1